MVAAAVGEKVGGVHASASCSGEGWTSPLTMAWPGITKCLSYLFYEKVVGIRVHKCQEQQWLACKYEWSPLPHCTHFVL